jgi:hypothetical protein
MRDFQNGETGDHIFFKSLCVCLLLKDFEAGKDMLSCNDNTILWENSITYNSYFNIFVRWTSIHFWVEGRRWMIFSTHCLYIKGFEMVTCFFNLSKLKTDFHNWNNHFSSSKNGLISLLQLKIFFLNQPVNLFQP